MISEADNLIYDDLDPEFLLTIAKSIPWSYRQLSDSIATDSSIPDFLKADEFARRRGAAVVSGLLRACEKHHVPFEARRLPCNGQHKFFVKVGRLTLIQEPILTLGDTPRIADYKRTLARSLGAVAQLELPLGDRPDLMIDFSQGQLVVLLHGKCGTGFSEDHNELGALMLAVPNAEYTNWVRRFDLHDLAMLGTSAGRGSEYGREEARTDQPDRVRVRPRRKSAGELSG